MGIRGFTSFVSSQDSGDWFCRRKLRNEDVVIDGDNLRYALFSSCPRLNSSFGGDYHKYREHVKQFFDRLLVCGIRCVVVLDGASDPSGIKYQTALRRAREQAKRAVEVNALGKSESIMPIFAKTIFIEVCLELRVKVIQSDFEADLDMARLASSLNCPVISGDSDFFINSIDFLPISKLGDVVQHDEEDRYVAAWQFSRERFLRHFGIADVRLLGLMSSLLGNDYVPCHTFNRFFSQIKVPRKKSVSSRHQIMLGLLSWLGREESCESAIEKVLVTIPMQKRPQLHRLLLNSMEMYCSDTNFSSNSDPGDVKTPYNAFSGAELPDWLASDLRAALLPTLFANVLCNRSVFLLSQVEDKDKESSHLFALPLLRQLCHWLVDLDPSKEYPKCVVLNTRKNTTMRPYKLVFEKPMETSVMLLRELSEERRIEEVLDVVGVKSNDSQRRDALAQVSDGVKLLCLSLFWWSQHCRVSKSGKQAIALVLTVHSILENFSVFQDQRNVFTAGELKSLEEKMKPYSTMHFALLRSKNRRPDFRFVYDLADLQAVLHYLIFICQLLCLPNLSPNVSSFWNGTMLHNVESDLAHHQRFDNRVSVLLANEKAMALYKKVLLVLDKFCQCSEELKKPKRERKKNKKPNKESSEMEERGEMLSNKFQLLSL